MTHALRIAALLTDAYGGFGGISRFNRDFLEGLDASGRVDRVHAFPRLIPEPIDEPLPESLIYHRGAAAGMAAYLRTLGRFQLAGQPLDLVVCGHLNLLAPAWALARAKGARLALIVHGIDAWAPGRRLEANMLARRVDYVLSVSHVTAERFRAWSGVPRPRMHVLPNCVDLAQFPVQRRDPALAARYGLEGSRVLLTLGRLADEERYKGFDEVIEVMPALLSDYPDLKYLIVGDGADRARLRAKADTLGLHAQVVFAGRIAEAEKAAHYGLADAYVMPSSGEGFGIVYLEAAACGVPVIGSRTDGSRDALLEGRLGQIVAPTEPDEIIAAVRHVLDDPKPRARHPELAFFEKPRFNARLGKFLARVDADLLGDCPTGAA
jgi:phosphatidylinositol alpha-1,6-mannosyltransferase